MALAGCGGDPPGASTPRCIPGTSQGCVCTTGANGAQTCGTGGAFEACVCSGGSDASAADVASADATASDAPTSEVATNPGPEAGVDDVEILGDATSLDAAAPDAGAPDAAEFDVGTPDAGQVDVGAPDVGAPDAGGITCLAPGLCNIVRVTPGYLSCALTQGGQIYCWRVEGMKIAIPGVNDATALAGTYFTACFLRRSDPGRVYCSDGRTVTPLPDGLGADQIDMGRSTMVARTNAGGVLVSRRGLSDYGRASAVAGFESVVGASALGSAACGRHADGSFRCANSGATAAEIPEYRGSRAVVGMSSTLSGVCLLRADSTVACRGPNTFGQLGLGTTDNDTHNNFTPVPGLTDVAQLIALENAFCARQRGGAVWCWGGNSYGLLGDGTTTNRPSPTRVSGLSDAIDLSGDREQGQRVCAIRANGRVVCWGANTQAMLGGALRVPTEINGLPSS